MYLNVSQLSTAFFISFSATFMSFLVMTKLKALNANNILRRSFYITSGKSKTSALLLGGLPLSLAVIFSVLVGHRYFTIMQLNDVQLRILYRGVLCSTILIAYGYLDDKFELRPIAKLFFQTITVLFFTLSTTGLLTTSHYSNIVFLLYFITGMALINGNNLLDGLDTLALKTNIPMFLGFAFMGYKINSPIMLLISTVAVGALCAFYFFNRGPAKIYLGEIGGIFLGFTYLILMALYQHHEIYTTNTINLFFYAAIPVSLPITELFVSFTRRLLAGKAPFKGDRLHLHYILVNYKQLSIPTATTLYALYNTIIIATSLIAFYHWHLSSLFITPLAVMSWITINHVVCHHQWHISLDMHSPLHSIFNKMKKQQITFIDINSIDQFELTVIIDQDAAQADEKRAA